MDAMLIINISIAVLVIFISLSAVKQVSQGQAAIIERLGKYQTTLEPGLNFVIPFFESKKLLKQLICQLIYQITGLTCENKLWIFLNKKLFQKTIFECR